MLQELTAQTNAALWAIASLLFFLTVYIAVVVKAYRARREDLEAHARLALDDGEPSTPGVTDAAGRK